MDPCTSLFERSPKLCPQCSGVVRLVARPREGETAMGRIFRFMVTDKLNGLSLAGPRPSVESAAAVLMDF